MRCRVAGFTLTDDAQLLAQCVLLGGQWQDALLDQYGRGYELDIAFRMPVVIATADDAYTTQTILNEPLTGTLKVGSNPSGSPAP